MSDRPIALITGASRRQGIAAAVARALATDGWDIATTYYRPYDAELGYGSSSGEAGEIVAEAESLGARTASLEADLSEVDAPARIFEAVEGALGTVTALVLSHCVSVDSGIEDTSVESFDRHFAVNTRATWLLVREFGRRYAGPFGDGRIIALTSDDVAGNLPYGASKGAMDRIVLAAAREFRAAGICANVVNPGPVDDGWMSDELKVELRELTPLGRLGTTTDSANLVRFLCSPAGGWINGQTLKSNGGIA